MKRTTLNLGPFGIYLWGAILLVGGLAFAGGAALTANSRGTIFPQQLANGPAVAGYIPVAGYCTDTATGTSVGTANGQCWKEPPASLPTGTPGQVARIRTVTVSTTTTGTATATTVGTSFQAESLPPNPLGTFFLQGYSSSAAKALRWNELDLYSGHPATTLSATCSTGSDALIAWLSTYSSEQRMVWPSGEWIAKLRAKVSANGAAIRVEVNDLYSTFAYWTTDVFTNTSYETITKAYEQTSDFYPTAGASGQITFMFYATCSTSTTVSMEFPAYGEVGPRIDSPIAKENARIADVRGLQAALNDKEHAIGPGQPGQVVCYVGTDTSVTTSKGACNQSTGSSVALGTSTPTTVATTSASVGTATTAAHEDHKHACALASQTDNGCLAATDKTKLDSITGDAGYLPMRSANGWTNSSLYETSYLRLTGKDFILSKDGLPTFQIKNASDSHYYPMQSFLRQRGTLTAPTSVQQGDILGALGFYGLTSVGAVGGAGVGAYVDSVNQYGFILGKVCFTVSDGSDGGSNASIFCAHSDRLQISKPMNLGASYGLPKLLLYDDGANYSGIGVYSNETLRLFSNAVDKKITFGYQTHAGAFTEGMKLTDKTLTVHANVVAENASIADPAYGFQTASFVANGTTKIWSLANATAWGMAYYQDSGGHPLGVDGDALGFHFGNAAAPTFYVRADGSTFMLGSLFVRGLTGRGAGKFLYDSDGSGTIQAKALAATDIPAHASTHSGGGADAIATAVASGAAGLMSGTDKAKLDRTSATPTAGYIPVADNSGTLNHWTGSGSFQACLSSDDTATTSYVLNAVYFGGFTQAAITKHATNGIRVTYHLSGLAGASGATVVAKVMYQPAAYPRCLSTITSVGANAAANLSASCVFWDTQWVSGTPPFSLQVSVSSGTFTIPALTNQNYSACMQVDEVRADNDWSW